MKRKFLSIAMVCLCALTSIPVMNVHAAETSVTETVTIEDDDFTDSQSKEEDCTVTVDIGSEFTVTIPKKIFLAGENGEGSYDVTAKGNIAALETINVIPENSFLLSSEGKDDVEAVVAQNQTAFTYADVMQVVENVLVGKTTTGNVSADNLTSGNWKGSFYFNINTSERSLIGVSATDEDGGDLNASATMITGDTKTTLLQKLIESGVTDTVTSTEDVDVLIEVDSDDFDTIATTTFDVSDIAEDGDTVVVLHYNEETSEWEYIGTYEVADGEVTADFTSFSPVAFVVVKADGSLHIHNYEVSNEVDATCTTEGSVTYECECGDSYIETIDALGHDYVNNVCSRCGAEEPGLYSDADYSIMVTSWDELVDDGVLDVTNGSLKCNDTSISGYLRISNDISEISNYAFQNCINLIGIDVPNNVTVIGLSAFSGCISLTDITMTDNVTTIGSSAFYYCTDLESITIPNGVTQIFGSAFSGCTSLNSVTIHDKVTYIGSGAFSGCTALESIDIPSSVTSIDAGAFSRCTSLASIDIPSSITSISISAFSGCTSLTNITIPDSVKTIGTSAFYGCTSLESIYIPSSVTTIGDSSGPDGSPFFDCSSSLKIYCGVSTAPSKWYSCWNYYYYGSELETTYGVTRAEYESTYN